MQVMPLSVGRREGERVAHTFQKGQRPVTLGMQDKDEQRDTRFKSGFRSASGRNWETRRTRSDFSELER